MYLRKFYENLSKKAENLSSNSDNHFTSYSNFNKVSKNLDSSNQYENDLLEKAFDKESSNSEDFQDVSQLTFEQRITSSSSLSSNRVIKSSQNEASRSDYAKLHSFRKRKQNSTRNSNNSDKSIENVIENINYF